MAKMIIGVCGGVIPDTIEADKTAGCRPQNRNLIVGDVYGKPAVVADTIVSGFPTVWGCAAPKPV